MSAEHEANPGVTSQMGDASLQQSTDTSQAAPRSKIWERTARLQALLARPASPRWRRSVLYVWYRAARWLRDNSFTPVWLPATWQFARVGYFCAIAAQILAIFATYWLTRMFPELQFVGALQFLAVVLIALSFGAGPSLLATLLGAILLDYVILPPAFSWSFKGPQVVGVLLYFLIGCIVSVLPSQTERARRHAEQAQQQSEGLATSLEAERARLHAIFETIADGVVVFDRRGFATYTNPAYRTLLALDQQPEILTRPIHERVKTYTVRDSQDHPIPKDEWLTTRILRGEVLTGSNATDVRMRSLDGYDLEFSVSGAPIRDAEGNITGGVAVLHDVASRRQLERRTQEALDSLLAMAEMLVQVPAELEAMEEHNTVAQRLAALTCKVLGCTRVGLFSVEPETQLQRPVAVVGLPPEQERRWWAEQEQQQVRFGEGVDPDVLARFVAGEPLIIDYTQPPYNELSNPYGITTSLAAPMRITGRIAGILSLDFGGVPHAFSQEEMALAGAVAQLGAFVLEHERLLHERETARAHTLALQEANRRMDEFLGIAGHELRTPITTMKANLQIAERRVTRMATTAGQYGGLAEQLQQMQHIISLAAASARRQERIVNDLLDASRIQAGKLEMRPLPCNLATLVSEDVEEQQLTNPSRNIDLKLPEGDVLVIADLDRIGQVVTNYLTNALKYSPPEKPVVVSVHVAEGTAHVRVSDEGPGLPPEEHEHIWERFYRTPGIDHLGDSGVGLGLGLHISKMIVERHGGMVGLESRPGQGSTFWFTLPLASADSTTDMLSSTE